MHHVPLAVKCIYGWIDEGCEDEDRKDTSELHGGWEIMEVACLLYADDLVLWGES